MALDLFFVSARTNKRNHHHHGGRVRDWLQNTKQDWAWENSLAQKILAEQHTSNSSRPSWRCPLRWLGQFHDDGGKHQARCPSWLRNKERFAHITGSFFPVHAPDNLERVQVAEAP